MTDSHASDPAVEMRRYAATPDRHLHGFHQLLLGMGAQSELEMNGQLYCVQQGTALIVPAGTQHDYCGWAGNCQIVLDLPVNSLALPARLFRKPFSLALPKSIQTQFAQRANQPFTMRRQHHWQTAVDIVSTLAAYIEPELAEASTAHFPVMQIERHLRERLASPIRINELASHFACSPRRFHDLFVEAFGEPPHRYLARLRLDYATSLLLQSGHDIASVALETGHADQPALTRSFSRRFGMPPGQWRTAGGATIHG